MNMEFLTIGINYQRTPVGLRERFALSPRLANEVLGRLKDGSVINEAIFLSTCNRAEIYAVTDRNREVCVDVQHELCANAGVDPMIAAPLWYVKNGPDAVRHLFRVASSLDAMVVGEAQVLGQIKDAYFNARECGTTGPFIDRAMLRAFYVARKVRRETGIGKGQVSVASVAVELAKKELRDLSDLTVLVIGAGEMGALIVRQLKKHGTGNILVANRTFAKAAMIAEHTGGEAIAWEDICCGLARADIVVSSTGSSEPVVDISLMQGICDPRSTPMVLIDLGTPRDIRPEVGNMKNVRLFNIDDLKKISEQNSESREKEAQRAEALVALESDRFFSELERPEFLTAISVLNQRFQTVGEQEIEKTLSRLTNLSEEEKTIIEAGARSIISKILHDPVRELKNDGSDDLERLLLAESLCRLFHLDEE